MPGKVLFSTIKFRGYEAAVRESLQPHGLEMIDHIMQSEPIANGKLLQLVSDASGLVAGPEKITDEVMSAAPQLRVICAPGVGYDHIDVPAASRRGIVVTCCPGANHHAVAEMALGLMIALARRICRMDQQIRKGRWHSLTGVELWGKTLGIVGLGAIGKGLALRARAMGMRVLATDTVRDVTFACEHGITYVPLSTLLREADFVSLHCPLTPETRGLINASTLAMMKPTAYLINTARGALVQEQDLAAALREGKLAGAGLDVLNKEPPEDNWFTTLSNVVVSPHAGGATTEAIESSLAIALQNVIAVLKGQTPIHRVN